MSTTSRSRRLHAGTAGLTVAALMLVACAQSPDDESPVTDPDETRTEVVVAWTGDINSMDPPNNPIEWNRELSFATYETLVNHEFVESEAGSLVWTGLDVAPGLADSWEIDGPTVTFHLNEDAVFYPSGNPVTAEDVYWSFDRALEHPGGYGLFNFNLAGIFSAPDQIEVIDDKTVSITFQNSAGDPLLLPFSITSLRFPHFGIIDSVAAQEHATPEDPWAVDYLDWNTLGSGAYYIAERQENEEIVFEAVPDYYRGQPAVTRVVATISANADLVALMKSGSVDIARAGLSNQQLDELETSGFTVLTEAVPNIVRLALAMDDERLADPLVRKAIAYAIPYEQINGLVYSGRGEKAESIVNPLSPGFVEAWAQYDYDLEEAQSLLEEAGVTALELPLFYDIGVVGLEDIALLMQESFAEIGITLDLIGQPTTQLAADRVARTQGEDSPHTGLFLSQSTIWLDDPDPTIDSAVKSNGSFNWSLYDSPQVDALHLENRFNQDFDARADAYAEIQEILAEDLPLIPMIVTGRSAVVAPGLEGFAFTPDVMTRYNLLEWK